MAASSPEGVITDHLLGVAGIAALVGNRIYAGKLPKNLTYPFVRQYNVSERSDMTGSTGTLRIQYSVFSKSQTEARRIARLFRVTLDGKKGVIEGVVFRLIRRMITNDLIVEDDTEVYETAVDFRVHYALNR